MFKKKELNINWKGGATSYEAKHQWLYNNFGRPLICDNCKTIEIPKNKKRWFEWANISGKYLRERSDWKRLCGDCHTKMDLHKMSRGEKHYKSKFTEKQIRVIKWALCYGASVKYLSKVFKVSYATIYSIKNNNNWRHISTS